MQYTLLEMTQKILSDMDSEDVNSISDSVEAQQIASVIEDTYFNIIAAREIPEHQQLLKITSASDSARPTYFTYPTNCKEIVKLFYNVDTNSGYNYREIYYLTPMEFLQKQPTTTTNATVVTTSDYTLIIPNNKMPHYYTTFDDYTIIMDSFDNTVESTLQEVKTRAYGTVYPTFTISDSFVPDLDAVMFPLLLAEAKSTCFSLFKSGSDPKVEQAARRLKSYVQNDQYRTKQENKRNKYGR